MLKVESELLDDHQVKLIVEIGTEPFQAAKSRAARKIAKDKKIPGFRPGKAPYKVILNYFGEGIIVEEALDILIDEYYQEAITQSGIKPYSAGKLEKIESVDPPKFEFIIPLEAEVEIGDYNSLRLPFEPVHVSDEQIKEVLENMRDSQAVILPVERAAMIGDQVHIKLTATFVSPPDGVDPILYNSRTFQIRITEDKDNEWPFPEFSVSLIGKSQEDTFEMPYRFPDDYHQQDLAKSEVLFSVKIEKVSSRNLPELNDEFSKSMGDFNTIDDLRGDIKKHLFEELTAQKNTEYDGLIINKLLETSSIKYPPQMLDREIQYFKNQLEHRLSRMNLDLDLYMKTRDLDDEGLIAEIRPSAEASLARSLILYEVASLEKIEADQTEVEQETQRTLDELNRTMTPKQIRKYSSRDMTQNIIGSLMAESVTRKTLEFLRNISRSESGVINE